jgi:hypothetical protein
VISLLTADAPFLSWLKLKTIRPMFESFFSYFNNAMLKKQQSTFFVEKLFLN